jgi:hypothetical protein
VQQNVLGFAGVAVPVGATGLGVHEPPEGVRVSLNSEGCWTGSHENGGRYEICPVLQESADGWETPIDAEQLAPATLPHVHWEQSRVSLTVP